MQNIFYQNLLNDNFFFDDQENLFNYEIDENKDIINKNFSNLDDNIYIYIYIYYFSFNSNFNINIFFFNFFYVINKNLFLFNDKIFNFNFFNNKTLKKKILLKKDIYDYLSNFKNEKKIKIKQNSKRLIFKTNIFKKFELKNVFKNLAFFNVLNIQKFKKSKFKIKNINNNFFFFLIKIFLIIF